MQCGRAPGRVVSSSTDVPPWPLLLLTLLSWPSASAKHCGFTSGLRQKPQTWAASQSRKKDEVEPQLCISMAHTADVPTVAAVARTRSRRVSISVVFGRPGACVRRARLSCRAPRLLVLLRRSVRLRESAWRAPGNGGTPALLSCVDGGQLIIPRVISRSPLQFCTPLSSASSKSPGEATTFFVIHHLHRLNVEAHPLRVTRGSLVFSLSSAMVSRTS